MKFCPFLIDGPIHQRFKQRQLKQLAFTSTGAELHSMLTREPYVVLGAPEHIMMPCVKFQAEFRFRCLGEGRILMSDVYERQWEIYLSSANALLPAMQKGVLNAWWTMVKKGNVYGLVVDVQKPLMRTIPMDQDVPRMLNTVTDLNTVRPEFEAMAV